MLTNSKIALSLALVFATPSAAAAAPKQASLRQTIIVAGSHLSLNSVPSTESVRSNGKANQSSNISQLELEGLARLIEDIDDFGK
jgi:hypothetical protein